MLRCGDVDWDRGRFQPNPTSQLRLSIGGKAADRGRRKLLSFAGCLAGLVAFIRFPNANSLFQVLLLMALIGLGMGVGNPAAAALSLIQHV